MNTVADVSRILWVTNIVTPYRASLWRSLSEQCCVSIVCLAETEDNRDWKPSDITPDLDVSIVGARSVTKRQFATPLYLPSVRLHRAIRRSGATTVVLDGWESPAFMQALLLSQTCGIPVVASYRSTLASHRFSSGPVDAARRWFFNRCDAVFTAGPASTEAVQALNVDPSKVVTGFNSVDVQAFAENTKAARAVPSFRGHRFLMVGQLIARKNIDAALQAFIQAADAEDTLDIVGGGPLRATLEDSISSLGLDLRVRLLGSLQGQQLFDAYGSADTLVLASTEEVWGLVVNEALAAGLHAVVSERAGVVPSVRHMRGVFVADPSVGDLARQMHASKAAWGGAIHNPEMLRHTPSEAGAALLLAVEVARKNRTGRRAVRVGR